MTPQCSASPVTGPQPEGLLRTGKLHHSLLSDFYPHGAVSKEYGAFLEDKGFATRAAYVIDKEGIIRWAVINGPGEERNADEYAAALAELS